MERLPNIFIFSGERVVKTVVSSLQKKLFKRKNSHIERIGQRG